MASGQGDFDIQIKRDARWVTEAMRDKEIDARALAKKYLKDPQCAGVRVVANRIKRDGSIEENIVFEETQTVSGDMPVRIVPIDVAQPVCMTAKDFFSLESRMTLNRLFRDYLEAVTLTPTEVLHNYKQLQRLFDRDGLLLSATSHIASLQTKGTEKSAKARQAEINKIVDYIVDQARQVQSLKLPSLAEKFSDTLRAIPKTEGNTPEYLAMVVLSRELIKTPNWIGKLDQLSKMAIQETDPMAILLLDTVIADLLGANVIQEILGWQRSLGSAIISMIDLADGIFDASSSDAKETTGALLELFKRNALPASQRVLIDRAMRQLKSSAPLYKADPSKEMEEYQRVLARLVVPGGILSGAQAAEAMTLRGTQFMEQGGVSGRRAAIDATVKALPDPARGAMYLAELSKTGLLEDHLDDIIQQLDVVFGANVIDELCRQSTSAKDRMVTATGAIRATATSALPDEIKEQVTAHIDSVLERYLVDDNIIERMDNPNTHLRDRAVMLVKFCGAGVLPEGKALALARKRVIKLLRQPSFDELFIEGIPDPQRAKKALRDFHKLLIQGGLA
jgi:hypothetical protein